MKLSLVTMVRNEADIIRIFLKHVDSLFDQVYIVDHHSIDGTTDLLKQAVEQRTDWQYFRMDVSANLQQKVTNFLITKAFQEGADFVFILDVDEFIQIEDRAALEKRLKRIENSNQVGLFSWINCLPEDISESEIENKTLLLQSPSVSQFNKVVIPRSCYLKDNGIYNSAGSHMAYWSNGKKILETPLGKIIHIPIRSAQQAIRKAIIPKIALLLKYDQDESKAQYHYQYNYFLEQIANDKIDRSMLLSFVHIYEDAEYLTSDQHEIQSYWASGLHTSIEQLNLSYREDLILKQQYGPVEIYVLIADTLISGYRVYSHSVDLSLEDDRIVVLQNEFAKENLNWEIQRDQLLSTIENLKQQDKRITENLAMLQEELSVQKGREAFFANSKSWQITKPLRDLMELFRVIKNKKRLRP